MSIIVILTTATTGDGGEVQVNTHWSSDLSLEQVILFLDSTLESLREKVTTGDAEGPPRSDDAMRSCSPS